MSNTTGVKLVFPEHSYSPPEHVLDGPAVRQRIERLHQTHPEIADEVHRQLHQHEAAQRGQKLAPFGPPTPYEFPEGHPNHERMNRAVDDIKTSVMTSKLQARMARPDDRPTVDPDAPSTLRESIEASARYHTTEGAPSSED